MSINGIDTLLQAVGNQNNKRFVLEDYMSLHQVRARDVTYAKHISNLTLMSEKKIGNKMFTHCYLRYAAIIASACYAQGIAHFWMSKNIFNKLLKKANMPEVDSRNYAKIKKWLCTTAIPFIVVEMEQEGSKPAMWSLGLPLSRPLEVALGAALSGLVFDICKNSLMNLGQLPLGDRGENKK